MLYYITFSACYEIEADTLEEARQKFLEAAANEDDVLKHCESVEIEKVNW